MLRPTHACWTRLARAVVAFSLWTGIAGADGPQGVPAGAPAVVLPKIDLAIVGEAQGAEILETRITSWFQGQTTTSHATRLAVLDSSAVLGPAGEPGVRVWVVLREAGAAARVFFSVQWRKGEAPRYLVNDVALDGALDELGMEQLAHVVYMSATALWAGDAESSRQAVEEELRREPVPLAPPRPSTLARPPPVASGAAPRRILRVGFEYGVRLEGDEGLAQTAGSTLAALWAGGPYEVGGQVHAQLLLPHQPEHAGVTADVRGASFGLGLALARRAGRRVWIAGELGPGIDMVLYRTASVDEVTLRPSAGGLNLRPLGYARIGARVDLGAVSVSCDAVLVAQLLRTHYDVAIDDQRSQILVPWLAQPGLFAGLSWQ